MAFINLDGHQYMSLTTFRKTGQGVPTPVWFVNEGGKLYVLTLPNAGKLKRIANNPAVTVAPCSVGGQLLGDAADGSARLLSGEEATRANACLTRKYGFFKRVFDLMHRLQGKLKNRAYIEITPR